MLTWDGMECRLITPQGYRFILAEKPALSFKFTSLYYEPEAGNSYRTNMLGERIELTEVQVLEIEDLVEYFMEETDFMVQAYSEPYMLFEGEMQRSLAEEKGFSWRVNEIPDHPASKWMGDHWERLAMVVLDNGWVNKYPDSICAHCVMGFAESEMDQVPERPSTYHTWDLANGGWIDPRTLAQAKIDAASSLRADFEIYRHESGADGYYVPDYESETWTWQVLEARSWLADHGAETPYIDAFLAARTDEDKPSKEELCRDIIENNKVFLATMAAINGVQWGFLHRVKHAQTNAECVAIQEEAHEYCASRSPLLEAADAASH